ncbi:MAG: hypothetical protein J1F41_04880 [Lachnospiraceae bacterium]|nr:hypothetical protein [Lachnospiraceae bacterium]
MLKLILLLCIFVVFIYGYNLKKIKARKENTRNIDSVRDFHNTYAHLLNEKNKQSEKEPYEYYTKYITKYNSSVDYRDKY